ncbi:hypothetical protein CRG98_003188, partial [Punica granatum]
MASLTLRFPLSSSPSPVRREISPENWGRGSVKFSLRSQANSQSQGGRGRRIWRRRKL